MYFQPYLCSYLLIGVWEGGQGKEEERNVPDIFAKTIFREYCRRGGGGGGEPVGTTKKFWNVL